MGRLKGVGFGNISQRLSAADISAKRTAVRPYEDSFVISGTQTAHLSTLSANNYAKVTAFDPAQNTLTCQGLCKASSESLTHGIIYAQNPSINAVIHIHHLQLWQQLLYTIPTTRATVPYGTPRWPQKQSGSSKRLICQTPRYSPWPDMKKASWHLAKHWKLPITH